MADVTSEWLELDIVSPIPGSVLGGLEGVISPVVTLLTTTLELTKGFLEASKLVLLQDISPMIALQAALSVELNNLIGSLQDAGVGFTFIPPEISDLRPLSDNLVRLAYSVVDAFDTNRPVSAGTAADVSLVVITARADSQNDLLKLWNKILNLIFNYDAYEFPDLKKIGDVHNNTAKGQTMLPDWSGTKLPEAIPFVGDVLLVLRKITESLVDISAIETELIDVMIEIMEDKIEEIGSILSDIEAIVAKLKGVEELSGDGLDVLYISGILTQEQLYTKITAAVLDLPGNTGEDVSALCAIYTTTPAVGDTLKLMFTGT